MSRIAIVDADDNVIGAEERKVVRAKGLRHRISRIFLVNDNVQILLHKRNSELKDNPGRWDQSVGGHVDENESYEDTAQRETKEELGVCMEKFEFEPIGKFYIEREGPGGFIRRFQTVFIANWSGGVEFDRSEIAEVKWFDIDEIDRWVREKPEDFTRNFPRAFDMVARFFDSEK